MTTEDVENLKKRLPDNLRVAKAEFIHFRDFQTHHAEYFDPEKIKQLDALWDSYQAAVRTMIDGKYGSEEFAEFKRVRIDLVRKGLWECAPQVQMPEALNHEYEVARHLYLKPFAEMNACVERIAKLSSQRQL